jgi:hypothetical protein
MFTNKCHVAKFKGVQGYESAFTPRARGLRAKTSSLTLGVHGAALFISPGRARPLRLTLETPASTIRPEHGSPSPSRRFTSLILPSKMGIVGLVERSRLRRGRDRILHLKKYFCPTYYAIFSVSYNISQ